VNGPFAGRTLRELMATREADLMGESKSCDGRFPLLLKFLDARQPLSVQVHPNDHHARLLEPNGPGLGKTEAWVILEKDAGSLLYAGLKENIGRERFSQALRAGELPDVMHSYEPRPGDCVFLDAGTIHAIGAGLTLFEVQQTSDITYRLYDWGRVDAKTGQPRPLHLEQSLRCVDFAKGPCDPVLPFRENERDRERLVRCEYFGLHRRKGDQRFKIESDGRCKILVGLDGKACVRQGGPGHPLKKGDVLLLPASAGAVECLPDGDATILEIEVP
jgi:mannose-6-phosphate isomerase